MKPPTPLVKFLIVDDTPENLVALEALLRRDGLEILQARSGDEALELVLEHDFALAFLDVNMPDMDGFQLAELMRGSARSRHVPIIFVTAAVQEQQRLFQGYDAGAVDFLFKPIEPRILRHKADTFFALYKQRQELSETLRLNELFVAAVTHDLRTPLNSVVIATEILLADASMSPMATSATKRLRASADRMSMMIEDLFDLARLRLGEGVVLERRPASLATIAETAVAEVKATAPSSTIELATTGDTEGLWDATRIARIVTNLLGNAVRHGAKSVPIRVECVDEGSHVTVAVRNGGVIDAKVRGSLFDPFRQRSETSARKAGLGLGLYIVDQLTRAHAGTVEVESTEADGTCFRVRLPRGRATPSP